MAKRRRRPKFFRKVQSGIKWLLFVVMVVVIALFGLSHLRGYIDDHPQDFPWTDLNLNDPVGYFSGYKLAGLHGDFGRCQQLLDEAGVSYQPFPPTGNGQCRRDDNISLLSDDVTKIRYSPKNLAPSCPVVAAMTIWEDQVVQAAAVEIFGQRVTIVKHLGSFNCRPISGSGQWSEHATANGVDIAAFVLEDGSTVSLNDHWDADDARSDFLKRVRDGSCNLFATVLSPDYNAAHADHFHLDQAERGGAGYRMCR